MAQHRRPDDRSHYVSEPVRAQHRWSGGFYTGEPDVGHRIRRFGETPHGWGNYEANYDLASARARRIDEPGYGAQLRSGARAAQPQGPYRGKGPKGYRRSDERTHEIICERLTDDPRIDASTIDVEVAGGAVRLTGAVDSRRTKHDVEDLVEECTGIEDITNLLRVARS